MVHMKLSTSKNIYIVIITKKLIKLLFTRSTINGQSHLRENRKTVKLKNNAVLLVNNFKQIFTSISKFNGPHLFHRNTNEIKNQLFQTKEKRIFAYPRDIKKKTCFPGKNLILIQFSIFVVYEKANSR